VHWNLRWATAAPFFFFLVDFKDEKKKGSWPHVACGRPLAGSVRVMCFDGGFACLD